MPLVLIAGAGIAGLSTALALAKTGLTVTILERAPELGEAGAGVQLSPNATRILDRLGLLDALRGRALAPAGIRVRRARTGRDLAFMPLESAEARWGGPYLVAHRAALQAVLLDAVATDPSITLQLDTAVAGVGATPTGVRVGIRQAGVLRSLDADALVGADGIRSAVRARLVDRDDAPQDTGRVAWRALVPAEAVDASFRLAETSLWLGPNAHLVHYPMQGGSWINVVAVTPATPSRADDDLWSAPGDPAQIHDHFRFWHDDARSLIAGALSWSTWPLFDRAPLAAWNAGAIALVGDAAHPILPFLAQGGAQAIEDAAALAEAVAATRDLPAAFAAYSRARQPRTTRVQEASRRLGHIYHLAGPAALARNAAMRALGGRRLLERYDWLYGVRPRHG